MVFYLNSLYDGFSYELLVCGGFSYELLVCDSFLFRLFLLKLFLVWKGVMCTFRGLYDSFYENC